MQTRGEINSTSEVVAPQPSAQGREARGRRLWLLPFLVLCIYSASLLFIEATSSQDHIRLYFTDIGMPPKQGYFSAPSGEIGYGINTSLSSFLFGCSGVLLLFAALGDRQPMSQQATLFVLQGSVFLYLSADDRLMLHERIGAALNIYSTTILVVVALFNIGFYLWLFRLSYFNGRMICMFSAAAGFTAVMMGFDLLMPHGMPMRLSSEDLAKTWAGFFFLQFAWEGARFRLVGYPRGERGFELPELFRSLVPAKLRKRFDP